MQTNYEFIKSLILDDSIGLVELNRPKLLNALNIGLMKELAKELKELDDNENIKVIVLTGNQKAFAAGADIGEMANEDTVSIMLKDNFSTWDSIANIKTPIIASVSGYALGGGLELVMTCDIIVAGEDAKFGQPEINLGVIPGAGGTQRLTRAIGKYRASELILTGELITARQMYDYGLINKVVPNELYLTAALTIAREIAKKSRIALRLGKEAINKSFDLNLKEGLNLERKNFYMLFSSQDQKEGMKAFIEKRKPQFVGR